MNLWNSKTLGDILFPFGHNGQYLTQKLFRMVFLKKKEGVIFKADCQDRVC